LRNPTFHPTDHTDATGPIRRHRTKTSAIFGPIRRHRTTPTVCSHLIIPRSWVRSPPALPFGVMSDDFPIQNESELRKYFDRHDPLTYAANRRGLQEEFLKIQEGRYGIGESHALFFVDLDHFKESNDLYGMRGGDQILIEVTQRLRIAIHPGGTVGRIGADQFVCLIPTR
jgi:GGDEF domain-containing protein